VLSQIGSVAQSGKPACPLGLSAHGLRKAMCRRLAEAGCSTKQIQAISGHATLKEVERYTKAVEQKRLAMSTINEQNWLTDESGSPKSSGKVLKVKGKK
jgi:integrase